MRNVESQPISDWTLLKGTYVIEYTEKDQEILDFKFK